MISPAIIRVRWHNLGCHPSAAEGYYTSWTPGSMSGTWQDARDAMTEHAYIAYVRPSLLGISCVDFLPVVARPP
jgi:hypothetical protein